MWAVDPPKLTAEATARACVQGMKDPQLKAAILAAIPRLSANSRSYQTSTTMDTLHQASPKHYPVPGVSDDQLRWTYRQRLARSRTPGRKAYDQLISAAPHGLCAYCRYGQAKTLDHFLPKANFASLAIEPWNLVPSCHQCNHHLGEAWSTDPNTQMLHPYSMPDLGRWLRATVEHTTPVVVTFFVDPEPSLDPILSSRIRTQFDRLDLANLYAVVSGQELSGLERRLPSLFADAGETSAFLLEIATSAFAADSNDRRGVMYEALGHDDWYCACKFTGN